MIDATKILKTDLLDILFDGRNKLYGAYELRRQYNRRMYVAVSIMIICCLLFFLLYTFASNRKAFTHVPKITDHTLVEIEPAIKKREVIPPPPQQKKQEIKSIKHVTPVLTNEEIKPEERLRDVNELENTRIGAITKEGVDGPDIVAPPINTEGTGVVEVPKKREEDEDGIVLHVQIESEYPGGIESWKRFLKKNIRYPEPAVEIEIEGTVLVQFIVDKAGVVSDVEAISGPNELRDEAVRVIRKSGLWNPAIQNGRKVKSYKRQPITFKLER